MMKRDQLLDQFTREELLEEAKYVETRMEWLHISLMGYKAETLRAYVNEYMPEIEKER